ncbi:THO complex subunit 6 homolog [Lineus longissimus]|uniref:THO complex subunit 6 homolog n=1 Tax=Lineus longissimus TaxID=88925 RepID=UPI002B4F37A7
MMAVERKQILQKLYTTVYCQCFSPCGKYLAACDNFGRVALFNLSNALAADATDSSWKPCHIFQAHDGPIYSLASSKDFLISAGTGDIKGWNWSDVINKIPKIVWALSIPNTGNFDNPETNSIALDNKNGPSHLFAGCGDNNIHMWDLESGHLMKSFEGHTDYVHSVILRNNCRECISGSEDGTVRVWDVRSPHEAVHMIEPYKQEECSRPQMGKWIGCVATDPGDDWLVCGGGPQLSIWFLRSLTFTTVFETPQTCQQHAMFYDDEIISAGTSGVVHHWNVNGESRSHVPCSPGSVFNVNINTNSDSNKVLSVAGNCSKIDVCTNFGYTAFSLDFC